MPPGALCLEYPSDRLEAEGQDGALTPLAKGRSLFTASGIGLSGEVVNAPGTGHWKQFDVLVDHADGRVGHPCSRSLTPFSCHAPESQANHRRDTMGAYCLLESVPSHRASVGEILEVRWLDYYGAVIFGDSNEIACIPHEGCRLEITATAPSPHRKVELLLPGQVIRYTHSFFLGDRFALPNGRKVNLRHLVGFKLQLASSPAPPPLEDVVVRRRLADRAGMRAPGVCSGVPVAAAPIRRAL